MNKVIFALSLVLLLTACGKEIVYRDKNVPVYMVPKPPTIERPELPIHQLDIDWNSPEELSANMGEIAQAYVISIRLLINWGEANEEIVLAYKEMSERDFSVEPITFSMAAPGASESDVANVALDSENDYGTIDRFARKKFREIENKYHEENELILQGYNNETEPDQEP